MTAADHRWLDLRESFDDKARQRSLHLLDRVADTVQASAIRAAATIVDIGAGTGNSARWFREHLAPRLPDHALNWVLVDSDPTALDAAAASIPEAHTIVAPITDLPGKVNELVAESTGPGQLVITCSAVLDVLTDQDLAAVIDTLAQHGGVGLFMLSITGQWWFNPADPADDLINQAFCDHQQRDRKLGADGPFALMRRAQAAGAIVESSLSPWHLNAPVDRIFIDRLLTERAQAVIEQDPSLEREASQWLHRRRAQGEAGLSLEIDHVDVYIDARGAVHRG